MTTYNTNDLAKIAVQEQIHDVNAKLKVNCTILVDTYEQYKSKFDSTKVIPELNTTLRDIALQIEHLLQAIGFERLESKMYALTSNDRFLDRTILADRNFLPA
jgi:uncharacterized membrane protein YjjP (DUF1212 family)